MYQALYRKYRPLYFSDVVGQDMIVKTLKNSIITESFGHAYMFNGSRGTGKTTVSKIFARSVNCLNPKEGEACGKCENCKNAFEKECVDIIEIDAASNNGVDEIRKIIDNINLVPSKLKYKVYIIDEVHMLSIGAFNALLKTLEEPPEHVIFILATTDPQKVPSTIISRCQCFNFNRLADETIVEQLKKVAKKEKIKVDNEVLNEIAYFSNGGMRDSLGYLDQLRAYTDDNITLSDFYDLNGLISNKDLAELVTNILDSNIEKVLSSLNNFNILGKNLIQIIYQLSEYIRNTIVDYYTNKENKIDIGKYINLNYYLTKNFVDIKRVDNPKLFIEMLLIKYVNDNNEENVFKEEVSLNKVSRETFVEETKSLVINPFENNPLNNKNEKENNITETVEIESVSEEKNEKNISDDVPRETSGLFIKRKVSNINEIMNVRFINTLLKGNKKLKEQELKDIEKLRNNSFDLEKGYLSNNLLDGTLCVVSPECSVFCFDHNSIVDQNLLELDEITSIYQKTLNTNKNLCFISKAEWDKVSKDFALKFKSGTVDEFYSIKDEPEPEFEETENDDIISSSAMNLFDNSIVEITN
ncbi:MAG: DNA polymerase III subunit gamma/tau [Bacilli bacterium]|nr:DNA polymerase III subunit gamma/tau [Bacilli bacterium]